MQWNGLQGFQCLWDVHWLRIWNHMKCWLILGASFNWQYFKKQDYVETIKMAILKYPHAFRDVLVHYEEPTSKFNVTNY